MENDELNIIARIDKAAKASKLSTATICERAVGNSRLYSRMTAGGGITIKTATRLLAFIDDLEASGGEGVSQ